MQPHYRIMRYLLPASVFLVSLPRRGRALFSLIAPLTLALVARMKTGLAFTCGQSTGHIILHTYMLRTKGKTRAFKFVAPDRVLSGVAVLLCSYRVGETNTVGWVCTPCKVFQVQTILWTRQRGRGIENWHGCLFHQPTHF